jgi:hypothetical protein
MTGTTEIAVHEADIARRQLPDDREFARGTFSQAELAGELVTRRIWV